MINLASYLQTLQDSEVQIQEALRDKTLNDKDRKTVEDSLATVKRAKGMTLNMLGNYDEGTVNMREALSTTDAVTLFPKIIEGKAREAIEPELLGVNFFDQITLSKGDSSSAVVRVPIIGEVYANQVAEGGTYNETLVDITSIEEKPFEVRLIKVGIKVAVTEETINDSNWDVYGLNLRKMVRGMARYKEQMAFNNFSNHGITIFDNSIRSDYPEAGTTGKDINGQENDSFAIEDLVNLVLAMMGNDRVPTDIIMHPLTWLVFASNQMVGNGMSFGAFGGSNVHPWGAVQGTNGFGGLAANNNGQKYLLTPESTQNRLPMPISVNFSPFVNFDKTTKRFDMYCLDRNAVGCIVIREPLSTGTWKDPERDILATKMKERYGMGIYGHGEGVTVARDIAATTSYPTPPTVNINTTSK